MRRAEVSVGHVVVRQVPHAVASALYHAAHRPVTKRLAHLLKEAKSHGVTPPLQRTLDTYGLIQEEWLELLAAQGWVCPICEKGERTWNTDHEHVAGWKNMVPTERKRYVRGVLCWYCNHRVVRSRITSYTAKNIYEYIAAYEQRRDA